MSNKVELKVEFLPSDWLEATQVTGFVLIQIFETFFFKRGRERQRDRGRKSSAVLWDLKVPDCRFHWLPCCKTLTVQ